MIIGAALLSVALIHANRAANDGSRELSWWRTILFATMPVFLLAVKASSPAVMLLPFVAAWLLFMGQWHSSRDDRWLMSAGASLGLGLYSHYAALAMMPVYLMLAAVAVVSVHGSSRPLTRLGLGFLVPAAPLVVFLLADPAYVRGHVVALGLYDVERFTPLQGIREILSWVGLTARSEVYWDYLNPALLFLSAGGLVDSVRHPEVFLLPFAVLLPVGAFSMATRASTYWTWIVVGGFLVSPVAAAITAQPPVAGRLLIAAPFAAILATQGLAHLASGGMKFRQTLAGALLLLCFLMFAAP